MNTLTILNAEEIRKRGENSQQLDASRETTTSRPTARHAGQTAVVFFG